MGEQPKSRVIGDSASPLWGMTSAERLGRALKRAGVSPEDGADGPLMIFRGDWVLDEALVKALAARPGVTLVDETGEAVAAHVIGKAQAAEKALDAGRAPAGTESLQASALVGDYNAALRKRSPPLLVRLSEDNVRAVERRTFDGSYKGVTDLVTKYLWPRPARVITRWCAELGITPNQVTAVSAVLTVGAFLMFWSGHFISGLLAAWAMTFLDTVDGKLARVTLTSSKFGNAFDHGIDLVHPPFWWWAWIVGLRAASIHLPREELILAVVVGGYIAQRIEEGVFLGAFKLEMHAWRRFDSAFRLITARRNPNLILLSLSALAGRPDLGIAAVAIWTAVCFVVHAVQIVQAFLAPRPITSWLAQ